MGQRPARRECRPRHDADAGCRNPEEAETILNRLALFFGANFSVCVAYLLWIWYNESVRKRNVGRAEKGRDGTKPP